MHSKSFFGSVTAVAFAIGALTHLPSARAALLDGGDIVTVEKGGAFDTSRLIRIEPVTGARTVLHDFGLGSSPLGGVNGGRSPAIDSTGGIFVADVTGGTDGRGALFRIDSAGVRKLVSDFGVGANPGQDPAAVAIEASGNLVVIDPRGSPGNTTFHGALFRVNPATGARTLLSDFGQDTLPDTLLTGVAVGATGDILVAGRAFSDKGRNALFRVNPATGARVVLSDFGPGVVTFGFTIAVEASGNILVADQSAGVSPAKLFRIDPANGARTVVSDFSQGLNPVKLATRIAVEPSGFILVSDASGGASGSGALIRVDPVSGARKVVVRDIGEGAVPGTLIGGVAVAPGQVCSSLGDKSSPGTLDTDVFSFNGKKREVVSVLLKKQSGQGFLGQTSAHRNHQVGSRRR